MLDRTWPYRANWELIGIELGIDQGSLEAIKKNCMNSGGVEECLKDMITKWLRSNSPKPTWLALNRALESVSGIYMHTVKRETLVGINFGETILKMQWQN